MWRELEPMSEWQSGLHGNAFFYFFTQVDCKEILINYIYQFLIYKWFRSLGLGIKKEEAKESGTGMEIYLYRCAALMLAALNMKKTVKME